MDILSALLSGCENFDEALFLSLFEDNAAVARRRDRRVGVIDKESRRRIGSNARWRSRERRFVIS